MTANEIAPVTPGEMLRQEFLAPPLAKSARQSTWHFAKRDRRNYRQSPTHYRSYHESIDNLTPADVYFGRGQTILLREKGSNTRPSYNAACTTNGKPRNVINQTSQSLP